MKSTVIFLALAIALMLPTVATAANPNHMKILDKFTVPDGANPVAGLIFDGEGNLYGTTEYGGTYLWGVVFKLSPAGKETVLYNFTDGADGGSPMGGLVRDAAGNLYGTTFVGAKYGWGVVFKLSPAGKFTALHTFTGIADGRQSLAGLILDAGGNLYGTTMNGGDLLCDPGIGCGVVFKLNPTHRKLTVLHKFTGGADGAYPWAGLILDDAGNLYGTTRLGGTNGAGVVFELDTTGHETVLYSFTGGADGSNPEAGVLRDNAGNFYGTTVWGGTYGYGVVFELDTTGHETVLYSFTGGADGSYPEAGVVRDDAGNLYGTTFEGGTDGKGVLFKVDTAGQETVLHSFTDGVDGGSPQAGLIQDAAGHLYGTTPVGGDLSCDDAGCGVVFKINP